MPDGPIQMELNARNVQALADNLIDLREKFVEMEAKQAGTENEIATMKELIQKQSQVIGLAMQNLIGRGSTVRDE